MSGRSIACCGNTPTSRRAATAGHAELYTTEFVLKLMKKRLFSSPAAFLRHPAEAPRHRHDGEGGSAGRQRVPEAHPPPHGRSGWMRTTKMTRAVRGTR